MALQLLVLAGGAGTRLWPASTEAFPKQFLRIGGRSLLRRVLERISPLTAEPAWISTHQDYVSLTLGEAPECTDRILAEPERRNTAPAIAWVLAHLELRGVAGSDVIALLPADQHVDDDAAFRAALAKAVSVAERTNQVVTLGIRPTFPATGYGYMETEASGDDRPGIRFVEKPDATAAQRFLDEGRHLWNAGIFIAGLDVLREAFRRFAPAILDGATEAANLAASGELERGAEKFRALPSVSIDYAVMEHLTEFRVVPAACGWSDVGSWETLGELLPESEGNRVEGTVRSADSHRNIVYSSRPVVLIGAEDLVVVDGPGGILVARRGRSVEVKGMRQ